MKISPADHAKITAAIAVAERRTAGEISCVLAHSVHHSSGSPWFIAAIIGFLTPLLAVMAGFRPLDLTRTLEQFTNAGWTGHPPSIGMITGSMIGLIVAIQLTCFLVAAAVLSLPPLRRFLTLTPATAKAVHNAAIAQFQALNLNRTSGRTAVLLFAALAERRAEVIADEGIYAKAPNQAWDDVIALLVNGMKRNEPGEAFAAAVTRIGDILAAHLPATADNPNEIPDELIELP